MGEVYRARDTKLDRTVALKVLPDAFVSDPERLARFEREAKVLASLNHPNIAQVYGFEGTAIAMELVEGPTLEDIIAGAAAVDGAPPTGVPAALPLDRALAIARQIATALEAAHDQGIIHRDLKPANVKVREDGAVKVLDFGLAKAFAADAEAAASGVSNSPTLTARSTQLGMILGTAAYMAPEQAKGRAVDRRADVWAFGVVLFEMLAGRRAFEGDDVSDVLASVLKTDPDWSVLPDLPAPVRRLIQRCLVKDPKRRLRDVAEGLLQMDEGLAAASATAAATSQIAAPIVIHERPPMWRRVVPIVLTAAIVAGVMYGISVWRTPAPIAQTPIRFTHLPPAASALYATQAHRDLVLSPDGKTIVYTSIDGALPTLWIRHLDQLEAAVLRGADGAVEPFVSLDNAWVGFVDTSDQTVLKKVSILGGPATNLGKMKYQILGASWTEDKSIIVGQSSGGLLIIGDGGGESKPLTQLDATNRESAHLWPYAVPGSSVVLFVASLGSLTPVSGGQLAAFDRATGRTERLKIQGVMPRYVKGGHLVYASQDGTLRAVKFDLKTMTTSGNPVPVVESVGVKVSGAAEYDVANDGRLVYASASSNLLSARTLSWVDRTGKETAIANAPPRSYFYARISPDQKHVALDIRDNDQNTWIWDLERETLLRLTDRPGQYQYGLWVPPDGQRVVFSSVTAGQTDVFRMNADATGQMERVTDTSKDKITPYPNAITPDGKEVIFRASSAETKNDLFVTALTGTDRKIRKLLATDHDEYNATISPDGKWIAYQSDLPGHFEVYVRPYPDTETRQVPLSTTGGLKPVWSPTGKEIFYVSNTGFLMAVPVDTTKGFVPGKPVQLFNTKPYFVAAVGTNYDVTKDGKRFIMVKLPEATDGGGGYPIVMVLNWADELASRLK